MRIDIVAPHELEARDIAAWRALQAADPACASPYLSPDWALACAAVDGPDRKGVRVVVLREGDDAVGFLAVRKGPAIARPVGAPLCDYQGMVLRRGVTVDPRAVARALGVARLDFTQLLADQQAFTPFMRGRACSQVIDIAEGYEAYVAARKADGHGRIFKDTAKKLRKLEAEQAPVEFVALSQAPADFEALVRLKRAQYRATRQTDIFDAGWPLELLRELFERRDPGFGGALFVLRAGGRPVAFNFALRAGPILHCWFIAHDRALDLYSPGVILIDQVLRWGADNGVAELDLGPGDYLFKMRLANRTREVAHGFVGQASPAALVRGAQYRVRDLAEALPLGRVSALPGKAMRRLDLWAGLKA